MCKVFVRHTCCLPLTIGKGFGETMNQTQAAAVQELERRAAKIREDAEAQVRELLRIAANLRGEPGEVVEEQAPLRDGNQQSSARQPSASSRIVPDQFRGMPRTMALEVYLRARRSEGRIPLANIVLDLLAGGLKMSAHRDRWERHIIACAQANPRIFGWDPNRREIWLAPTADEPRPAKGGGKGKLKLEVPPRVKQSTGKRARVG